MITERTCNRKLSGAAKLAVMLCFVILFSAASARRKGGSSLVEDRAAKKLLEAGDARYESDELKQAVEVWQSVIERYPRSRVRFEAHMRLGNYFLERERAYDRARVQFNSVITDENPDEQQKADATLKMGICFYEARNFGKSFQVMRDVIEKFPVSEQVNQAYYYIGLGHFQLGHYRRAIDALEKVGTALAEEEGKVEKVEAGKRFFIKINDADLAALEPGHEIRVRCAVDGGDVETVGCYSVGRNVRLALGAIPTRLGRPVPGNGQLEVKGNDKVTVTYVDRQTADKKFDQNVICEVTVVGDAVVRITDGAYASTLLGVVMGKSVNIEISDPDLDVSDGADKLSALVEVFRAKTDEELEAEALAKVSNAEDGTTEVQENETKIDRFKQIDQLTIRLTEAKIERQMPALAAEGDNEAAPDQGETTGTAESPDDSIHTGVFRATVPLVKSQDVDRQDASLQASPGDIVRVTYVDRRHSGEGLRNVQTQARSIEGSLGGVRVTKSQISDQELRIRTKLKTAGALTNIGNRYKEFGLKKNADAKYEEALQVCEEIVTEARRLGGSLLEETYVQLWQTYFEMDNLSLAAAMAQRLQREFPTSGFVDDALLQLAEVARKSGDYRRAIGIYNRLVNMEASQLRGEAQFGVAGCYDLMADEAQAGDRNTTELRDRAFQEYKKVLDNFPESGRVGEAVSKMAAYYYQQKDYSRAIDTFETVLTNYPDAKFIDVILFNYGRCLYRMDRKAEARRRFEQLLADYPESELAADVKKISETLADAGF